MEWRRVVLVVGLVVAARCNTTAAVPVGELPPAPDAGLASEDLSTFAVQSLFLGEAPADGGPPGNTAWRAFGYDLDGLLTTETSSNACTLVAGAPPRNQVDGRNGIDNAWGAGILPILQVTYDSPSPSSDVSNLIDSGSWTLQIQIRGLTSDPHQTAPGLQAQVFVSGASASPPTFDPSTDWPVLPSSLEDGQSIAGGASVRFPKVYVTNGMVVAQGASQPIVVPLVLPVQLCIGFCNKPGTPLPLPIRIHNATLTFVHSSNDEAAHGLIAGVLDTQELIDALRILGGRMSVSLCGSAFDGVAQQVTQAQDILQDGTNAPGVSCNAISIGLGFVAKRVANPTKVGVDAPPQPDPCDAGTD